MRATTRYRSISDSDSRSALATRLLPALRAPFTVLHVHDIVDRVPRHWHHANVVLADLSLDDDAFVALQRSFGELTFTKGETHVDGHPDLNVVSNVGRATPPKSAFHVDTSYVRDPPAYTALRAVQIPDRGGSTQFTNQYRAYETLPEATKKRIAGLKALNTFTYGATQRDAKNDELGPHAIHPRCDRQRCE